MDTVGSVLAGLGRLAPEEKAAAWDRGGLQLGDPNAEAGSLALCHEVTDAVVEAALGQSIDLLISYHPLLFRPVTSLVAGSGVSGRAFRLLRGDVALGVVHTSWDVAPGGTADSLAAALGLSNVKGWSPLEPQPRLKLVVFVPTARADEVAAAMAGAGAGSIGNYSSCSYRSAGTGTFVPGEGATPSSGIVGELNREDEVRIEMLCPVGGQDRVIEAMVAAHPYEEPAFDLYETRSNLGFGGRWGRWGKGTLGELVEVVRSALGDTAVRAAGDAGRQVGTVAVMAGSGGFAAAAAMPPVDAVVTGDVDHHQAVAALDHGVAVIDAGHVGTERPGVAALLARMRERWPRVADLTLDSDPWTRTA